MLPRTVSRGLPFCMIRKLQIYNLRNISGSKFLFSPGFNLISGDNGAGKTTVLEALYLLGHGRTFRSRYARQLVKYGKKHLQVVGQTFSGHVLGIEKGVGRSCQKINGKVVDKQSALYQEFPVFSFHPASHLLLQGSAKMRLLFIDRNLFHVKHCYSRVWHQFYQALRQRNMALRREEGNQVLDVWDQKVVELSKGVTAARKEYVSGLSMHSKKLKAFDSFQKPLQIRYKYGWDERFSYSEVLRKSREHDRHLGYTSRGPHRADLEVLWEGRVATRYVSRGQHKLIVCMLIFAAACFFCSLTEKKCVFLVDDLGSELDKQKQGWVLEELRKNFFQVFIGSSDENILKNLDVEKRFFMMEDGTVGVS